MSTSSVPLATPQSKVRLSAASRFALFLWCILSASLVLPVSQANAVPGIRFQWSIVRATVSVNTTNTSFFNSGQTNNSVVLVDGATNAIFDIAGLPAGVTATLQDTNGVPLTSITGSSNVWLALNTTNLPEGIYTFTVDATGTDTNGNTVTNFFPFVVQSAFIWNAQGAGIASFNRSNNWAGATNWVGGVAPGTGDDVVFSDAGSQTNVFSGGLAFTNVGITANTTISSLRFSQSVFTNLTSTNGEFHTLWISPNTTLSVTGAVGFSLLRDYVPEFGFSPDGSMGVGIGGTNGTLVVSNASANFAVLIPGSINPSLSMSNLGTFAAVVNRFGVSDYQLYPNYLAMNQGYNGGRTVDNYSGLPRRFWSTVQLARTNIIKALYHDPNNYTNEFTRGYALSLQNNEQGGNGSSVNTFFSLGVSNTFLADSVLFIGANSASGNGGGTKFFQTRGSSAYFRGTNGGRMTIMAFSDDGGTNEASSNVKSTTDFWVGSSNYVDILADQFYVARDRTMIASNQTPNVQGDVTVGYGNVNVNTAILGFQEHSNKIDWTTLDGASPYLNYCEGRLVLTNGGTGFSNVFRVNGNLTLGFTADINPVSSAQQFNTFGRITIYSNVTLIASNIICDGGLNFYDDSHRQNSITINQGGNLVVSNTAGFPNLGASDFSAADPRGMPLDTLTLGGGGVLTLQVDPTRTNVFVRSLLTPGIIPGVLRVAKLTGVTSYPAEIPVISYQGTATPFLNADVSALGAGFFGYVLNNAANHTVDLFIATNAPNNLVWTGSTGNNTWDTNSFNWVPVGGGAATNFHTGDIVTFNDSSSFTNVIIADSVVPGQTGAGVTISNSAEGYVFSGGTIAGTALVVKQGTNSLEFDATEQGPINVTAGSVVNGGSLGVGTLGTTTISSNVFLNCVGAINGGLTSTGGVVVASAGTINGPVSVQGGYLDNSGTINTTANQLMSFANCTVTNELSANINIGAGVGNGATVDVTSTATLANFGTITLFQPRIQVEGLLFGNGTITDPNGGGLESVNNGNAPRVLINQGGTMGVGLTPSGSIDQVNLQCRFDFNNDPTANPAGISTILLDVDLAHNPPNDIINCDRWNNDTGLLLLTNINPGAGTFTNGMVLTIFNNTSGSGTNNHVDTTGFSPFIQPYVPGPGLVWNVTNFNTFGTVTVTTNGQIWDGTAGGNWSTNVPADTSWKTGQLYQDYGGAYFDDSASGTTTVTITAPVSPAGIRGTVLDSNQPTFFPGITVSNAAKDYVFAGTGKITGVTGIYKTGSGTLTLLTTNANDFSGNVIVDNGTLAVSNAPVTISGSGNILSLGAAGGGQMKNDLILDGGTLSYLGLTNVNLNHFPVLYPRNGTFAVISATNVFTLDRNISGAGSLTKIGPGTLSLGGGSVHTGGTIVQAGTLRLTGNTPGTGALTFNNNTSLELTNNNTLTNTLNMGSGIALRVLGAATNVLSGPWTGSGSVTFSNTNVGLATFAFSGALSNYSGSISFGATAGSYVFNNATNRNPCLGSALASFDLGTGGSTLSNFNGGGLVYDLGSLAGAANTVLAGRMSNSPVSPNGSTYRIGANGNNTTFSGKIADGLDSVTVVKVGTGSLLLNGINTFTGGTTVSNGTLGGTGSLASALTVASGGTLSPGAPMGTFTVGNSVTLSGAVLINLNNSGSPNCGTLSATGTITGGGTLTVTNIGPDIVNGTKFQLFNKAVTGFTTTTLPPHNPANTSAYTWQNNIGTDGSITLTGGGTSGVNTNPTNVTFSVSGSTLTLTWPGDHQGWQLQSNPISLTTTDWYQIVGSTSVTQESMTIDRSKTNVFFRMIYPPAP
jgi:autotransporter-associated beta strand protein